jgi:hypothetical protein
LRGLLLPATLALVAAACGGRPEPVAAGRAAVVAVARAPDAAACLRRFGVAFPTTWPGSGVLRAGALGRSLTFRMGRRMFGCDGVQHGGCASSVGLLRAGVLVDPRLSLTCRTAGGHSLGFAWVEPLQTAARIVAGVPPESEPAAGGLPVRVTTTDVRGDTAVFRIAQFGTGDRELERRRLIVRAAG